MQMIRGRVWRVNIHIFTAQILAYIFTLPRLIRERSEKIYIRESCLRSVYGRLAFTSDGKTDVKFD